MASEPSAKRSVSRGLITAQFDLFFNRKDSDDFILVEDRGLRRDRPVRIFRYRSRLHEEHLHVAGADGLCYADADGDGDGGADR